MAARLEALVSGLKPAEPTGFSRREAVLRDLTWVLVLLQTVRDSEAMDWPRRSAVHQASVELAARIEAAASSAKLRSWAAAIRLDEPVRWSWLEHVREAEREPLVAVGRTLFLLGVELSPEAQFAEEAGPLREHWLEGAADELRWLGRLDEALGSELEPVVGILEGLVAVKASEGSPDA